MASRLVTHGTHRVVEVGIPMFGPLHRVESRRIVPIEDHGRRSDHGYVPEVHSLLWDSHDWR